MTRIFDYDPLDEQTIVDRVLVRVHQAVDEAFPRATPASRRFAKTVFADEPTINQVIPAEIRGFQSPDDSKEHDGNVRGEENLFKKKRSHRKKSTAKTSPVNMKQLLIPAVILLLVILFLAKKLL